MEKREVSVVPARGVRGDLFFLACGVFHDTTDITDGGRESVPG